MRLKTYILSSIPHYKQKEEEHTKLGRHLELNDKEDIRLQKDWKKDRNFKNQNQEHKESFMNMMN